MSDEQTQHVGYAHVICHCEHELFLQVTATLGVEGDGSSFIRADVDVLPFWKHEEEHVLGRHDD